MGIFQVKNKLSEVCETVAAEGETVVVTRHGKPVAQIVPYPESAATASVWDSVKECRTKYGPLTDTFELPARRVTDNRGDPLA